MTSPLFAYVTQPTLIIPEDDVWEGTYYMELGRIRDAFIGFEDHGIFAWNLDFTFGGTGQGTGCYGFGPGTDVILKKILKTVSVNSWDRLKGSHVYVLRDDRSGPIIGLANIDNPDENWTFFREK